VEILAGIRSTSCRILTAHTASSAEPTGRTLMPPTGSSWIAVMRWRPRPSCLPHGDRPWRWSRSRVTAQGVNGSRPGRPDAAGLEDRAAGWPGCWSGACGPRAIRGREADASPKLSSRPGSGRRPDARERRGGVGRCGPGSPGYRTVRMPGVSRNSARRRVLWMLAWALCLCRPG
jgi:hypothetical protein